jgi:hypothetical protein
VNQALTVATIAKGIRLDVYVPRETGPVGASTMAVRLRAWGRPKSVRSASRSALGATSAPSLRVDTLTTSRWCW